MKERKDIPAEYKWDLTKIYKTEEDFLAEYRATEAEVSAFGAHKDTMLASAKGLCAALDALASIEKRLDKLWTFAALGFYVDTSDTDAQARNARVRNLAMACGEATWFVTPYLIKLDGKTLDSYFKECPGLRTYRRMIEKNLRAKPHTLSDECEKLYSGLEDCLYLHSDVRNIFASSDLRFGKTRDENGKRVELTDSNYISLMMSESRAVRRGAFKTLYATYDQFKNTFAQMYYNHVKENATLAKVRGYADSRTASTYRDEVTTDIYDNLIENVKNSLPILFKYYDLKREVLGLGKLHIYDIYTPLIGEVERQYTYDEAREEVLGIADIYGGEYAEVLRAGLYERGWVDVYPSRGKRSGAFSAGCSSTEPYILLNFIGSFEDVSTLAHEAGHSMHSYFSRKHNEPHNSQYTLFVAEVASTVNELLLLRKKAREADTREEKLSILNQLMELYKATLYRQVMLAEFERDAHRAAEAGEPLTSDKISGIYYSLVKEYFGPRVVCDKEIAYEWMRIPHFYTCFYVYKYATCISAASAIVERIESEGAEYVTQYIEFLKCGDSKSPLESLLVAGIDMTSPDVVKPAIRAFSRAVEEFKEVYNGGKE
ncbi:MAG: oligoendopeptidase F [Clostridia bacterium]|nr:oligoendopeptidase F [Clostridia bacterium]